MEFGLLPACRAGKRASTFPVAHPVEPSVCEMGTIRLGMVPVAHPVEPSVCRLGIITSKGV